MPTQYRVVVSNGCGSVLSTVATVGIHNYWTGVNSSDWNDAGNWSDNLLPTASCTVYIPNSTFNQPTLGSGVATINSIIIYTGATLTVNNTGKLQVAGSITNTGTLDVTDGALEFNGASQSVSGSILKDRSVKDLIVTSGGTGLTVSNAANDTLNILGSLTFGNTTADLHTGNNVTLKSTISGTANLGQMATGNIITGDVTVERYIATGNGAAPNHGKSWQLLAIPTQGQTIKESWQEGATATNISSPGAGTAGNPKAGLWYHAYK